MKLKPLLVVLLAGAALSGCHRMDPNPSEAKRQTISKGMLRTSEDTDGMLRRRLPLGMEKLRTGSARLHQLADQPWQYFPSPKVNEEGEDIRAKDKIWQRQQELKAVVQILIDAMSRLQNNTRQATLTPDNMHRDSATVEDACEACHKKFRAL